MQTQLIMTWRIKTKVGVQPVPPFYPHFPHLIFLVWNLQKIASIAQLFCLIISAWSIYLRIYGVTDNVMQEAQGETASQPAELRDSDFAVFQTADFPFRYIKVYPLAAQR